MSDEIKDTTTAATEVVDTPAVTSEDAKGKGKAVEATPAAEDEDDDDEEDEDEEMDDEDDESEEEDFSEIDPSQIITSSRRSTRTVVDYASEEAAKKAGLNEGIQEDEEEDEGEASFMKTDEEDE